MATLARWNRTIQDGAGNALNATITVYKESDGLIATIYSDRAGATPKSNPFTLSSADQGYAYFHAVGGAYKIVATYGSYVQTWRYEAIGTAGEYDVAAFTGAGQAPATVNSRTELKALSTATYKLAALNEGKRSGMFVFLYGDYSALVTADAQEGVYVKATDTASSSGAWVRVYATAFNVLWFGATGDGSTDDLTAVQAAISLAVSAGADIYAPKGTYKVSSALSVTGPVAIRGAGPLETQFSPATNSIATFAIDSSVGPTLSDFGIQYPSQGAAGGNAISVTKTSGECGFLHAINVRINNAYNGFYFLRASQWVVDGCTILDSTQAAFWIENQNNVDSGDSTITNCKAANPNVTGATYGLIWRSSGGLRVSNNKFNGFRYGLIFQLGSAVVTGDVLITGNSIESVGVASVDSAIAFQRLGTTGTLHSVTITGNQINGWAAGIQVPLDATGAWLTGLTATGNVIYGNTGAAASGFIVHSTTGFALVGNVMRSGVAGTVFFQIGSSATSGYLAGNQGTGTFSADVISSTSTVLGLVGALGANDNRIVRVDGTGGLTAQGSAVSIDDSGNIAGVGTIDIGSTDTTLSRASAGDVSVEGNLIYRAGGTDVPIADGGTGASTAAAARTALFGVSTTVDNTISRYDGTTGAIQSSGVVIDDSNNVSGVVALSTSGSVTVGATSGGTVNGNTLFQVNDAFPTIGFRGATATKAQLVTDIAGQGFYFDAPGGVNFRDTINGGGVTWLALGSTTATFGKPVKTPSYTVATLPSAATVGAGAKAYVTDSNTTTYNATVAGGGANKITVTSDGANWKVS